jgi:hypothetical protein
MGFILCILYEQKMIFYTFGVPVETVERKGDKSVYECLGRRGIAINLLYIPPAVFTSLVYSLIRVEMSSVQKA